MILVSLNNPSMADIGLLISCLLQFCLQEKRCEQQSGQNYIKVDKKEPIETHNAKQNNQIVVPDARVRKIISSPGLIYSSSHNKQSPFTRNFGEHLVMQAMILDSQGSKSFPSAYYFQWPHLPEFDFKYWFGALLDYKFWNIYCQNHITWFSPLMFAIFSFVRLYCIICYMW